MSTLESRKLDDQVSVSAQFGQETLAELKSAGVEVVVCNRPEEEAGDVLPFDTMRQAAAALGMEFVAIPFSRGQMTRRHCEEFAQLLQQGKRVHAFCRTGNRSSNLWAGARTLQGIPAAELIEAARNAGFDVSGVTVALSGDD